MKYLKYFEQASDYASYKDRSDFITPNVSWVKAEDVVFYNPRSNEPSLLPLKFKAYYDGEYYDMFMEHKDESNKDYNIAIYNTIVSLINKGTATGLYEDSVSLYIERDEVTEDTSVYGYDYLDPSDSDSGYRYEDYSDGEYIILHGYSDNSIEWIYLYADGSIRVAMGD